MRVAESRVFPVSRLCSKPSSPREIRYGGVNNSPTEAIGESTVTYHPTSKTSGLTHEEFQEYLRYYKGLVRDAHALGLWLLSDDDRHFIERAMKEEVEKEDNEVDRRDEVKRRQEFEEKLRVFVFRTNDAAASSNRSEDIHKVDVQSNNDARDMTGNTSENKSKYSRIMFAEFYPMEIVTKNTVGRFVFGKYGAAANEMFLKSKLYIYVCLLLWWFGFLVSVLSIFGRLSPEWTLASLLMLPLTINGYLLMNVSVLYLLLMCFDFYYCVFNFIVFLISYTIYNSHTQESTAYISIFAICYGLSAVWGFLTDAQPAASRKVSALTGIVTGIISGFVILLGLYLHWMVLSKDEILELPHVAISASSQCNYSLVTSLLFAFRNLVTSIMFPDSMVLSMRK